MLLIAVVPDHKLETFFFELRLDRKDCTVAKIWPRGFDGEIDLGALDNWNNQIVGTRSVLEFSNSGINQSGNDLNSKTIELSSGIKLQFATDLDYKFEVGTTYTLVLCRKVPDENPAERKETEGDAP